MVTDIKILVIYFHNQSQKVSQRSFLSCVAVKADLQLEFDINSNKSCSENRHSWSFNHENEL